MAMEIEIVATHVIKPSSPTPLHLKIYKLSLLDQIVPSMYTPLLLFYPTASGQLPAKAAPQLMKSLSDVLVPFYPFAGRINGNASIDCNDDGVPFSEAQVRCSLSDVLIKPDATTMKQFLPTYVESEDSGRIPLLVRVNLFECGGMAIGVCASHKIADAATLSTFISAWAATTTLGHAKTVIPEFIIASLYPPSDFLNSLTLKLMPDHDCVTKRYVFDASSIAALKAKSVGNSARKPTRVESVSALIWKCAVKASTSNSISKKRSSIMIQVVNMRRRFVPPLSEKAIGNFVGYFPISLHNKDESEIELCGLVGELQKGLTEFCDNYVKKIQGSDGCRFILETSKESGNLYKREDIDLYSITSWCGFNLYDADFGWGKPTWASIASSLYKNVVLLMDKKDGDGIEAWVNLKEEVMMAFEQDKELLAFATPNPSILDT